jgi:hypothetical protein
MKTRALFRSAIVAMAAACLFAPGAQADTTTENRTPGSAAYTPPPSGPSVNNDAFKKLRETCEKDVPSGKANGDICAEAAAILVGNELPDEFRETKEDQRIKIALRLLERGVDNSNLARGRAYDFYNRVGFLGLSSFADPYRAQELMDMMLKSGYPGGALRRMRSQTTLLSFGASEAEKREACNSAKKILAEGKLDADSAGLAKDIVGSNICTNYEPITK